MDEFAYLFGENFRPLRYDPAGREGAFAHGGQPENRCAQSVLSCFWILFNKPVRCQFGKVPMGGGFVLSRKLFEIHEADFRRVF